MHADRIYLCVPLKTKTVTKVVQAYVNEIYAKFLGSAKILSDNGTGLINQLFMDVAFNWKFSTRTTPLLTIHNQAEELKGFITSLQHVCLNMYQNLWNGIKLSL